MKFQQLKQIVKENQKILPREIDVNFFIKSSLPSFMVFLSTNLKQYENSIEEIIRERIKDETYDNNKLELFIKLLKFFLKYAI